MKTVIDIARAIAESAHQGQFRSDGVTPYIDHPETVANMVRLYGGTTEAIAAAWLHDVRKNTKVTYDDLLSAKIPIHIIEIVKLLTKSGDQVSDAEFMNIVKDPNARLVKMCDMLHNLSGTPTFTAAQRYKKHLQIIFKYEDENGIE
jgi:(p)ppGpp synthase/HD superfamily hydrolase